MPVVEFPLNHPKTLFASPPTHCQGWGQLYGSATALAIAEYAKQHHSLVVVIASGVSEMKQLEAELSFFLDGQLRIFGIPDWETLPYDHFSPHQDIVAQRLKTFYYLPQTERGILLVTAHLLAQKLTPCVLFKEKCLYHQRRRKAVTRIIAQALNSCRLSCR